MSNFSSLLFPLSVTITNYPSDDKINSLFSTVQTNSSTNWNYQGTDIKVLTAGWVGGSDAYTNLVANSAAYLSSSDLSFLSVSANWNSTYTTVQSNSSTWGTGGGGSGSDVTSLSGNWESTYTTVNSNSATTWNYQGTDLKSLSANWQSTYTTLSSNSASYIRTNTSDTTPVYFIRALTQTQYDAISIKDPNTLYFITT